MVTDAASARSRIRLILDRANSPWLTNSEINGFIETSINEYIRERVNDFGANQKIRDDFGGFVKTVTYTNEPLDAAITQGEHIIRRQYTNYIADSSYDVSDSVNMQFDYSGGEWGIGGAIGTGCLIKDEDDDEIFFGYLIDIKIVSISGVLTRCEVMSLDKALSIEKDPFNAADSSKYHAVRVNDFYWIRPGVGSKITSITYVSDNNAAANISWLPTHGREEVCQIAARKILGTVADERYQIEDNELKQLEGK